MSIRSALRTVILSMIPDASIANGDVDNAITAAHLMFPGNYFVDCIDESTITLATDNYEYDLPETSGVSTFVYIYGIWVESETAGLFEAELPHHLWTAEQLSATSWQLRLSRAVPILNGRKLRIVGQRKYVTPAVDGDEVELHEGWVLQYALAMLHSSRGGSGSDMAAWHRQMSMAHFQAAADVADNVDNRVRPGSVPVPGVFT